LQLETVARKAPHDPGIALISRCFGEQSYTPDWYLTWLDRSVSSGLKVSARLAQCVETRAGSVWLLREDCPRIDYDGTVARDGRLERAYLVTIRRDGSAERGIGHIITEDWTAGQVGARHPLAGKALTTLGFDATAKFTRIDRFFPMEEAPELKRDGKGTGNGIGTALMLLALRDSESDGAAGAFVAQASKGMRALLRNNGFFKRGIYLRAFGCDADDAGLPASGI
jgi:hypothetical protein